MSDHTPGLSPPELRARRKALGFSRREMADRCGLDPQVIQLAELGQWSEKDALQRIAEVLYRAESGELDVHLGIIQAPAGAPTVGSES